jgi:hypothetical protein
MPRTCQLTSAALCVSQPSPTCCQEGLSLMRLLFGTMVSFYLDDHAGITRSTGACTGQLPGADAKQHKHLRFAYVCWAADTADEPIKIIHGQPQQRVPPPYPSDCHPIGGCRKTLAVADAASLPLAMLDAVLHICITRCRPVYCRHGGTAAAVLEHNGLPSKPTEAYCTL